MKRLLCLILILTAVCGLLPAGNAETATAEGRNEIEQFTVRVPEGAEFRVYENGASYICLKSGDVIPYVFIDRRTEDYDPIDYLHNYWPQQMAQDYGDRLAGVGRHEAYAVGGKTMPAVSFIYKDSDGTSINEIRLWETRSDGNVEYLACWRNDEKEAAMAALDTAVRTYQPYAAYSGKTGGADAAPTVKTAVYDDGRFSVRIPEGWKLVTDCDYGDFCFKVYDPSNPNRAYFLFMSLAPFVKSRAAREFYRELSAYDQITGIPTYSIYASAPILEDLKLESFLKVVPEAREAAGTFYRNYRRLGLGMNPDVYPQMNGAKVFRNQGGFACITAKDDKGNPIEGLMTGKVMDGSPYYDATWTVDISSRVVLGFTGMTAPEGEMSSLLPLLTECLASFSFKPKYVKEAVGISEEWKQTMLAQGETMQAMHDAMVQAWLGN